MFYRNGTEETKLLVLNFDPDTEVLSISDDSSSDTETDAVAAAATFSLQVDAVELAPSVQHS